MNQLIVCFLGCFFFFFFYKYWYTLKAWLIKKDQIKTFEKLMKQNKIYIYGDEYDDCLLSIITD
jgi:hypothetical protein